MKRKPPKPLPARLSFNFDADPPIDAKRPHPSRVAVAMGRALQRAGQARGDQDMVEIGQRREQQGLAAIRRRWRCCPTTWWTRWHRGDEKRISHVRTPARNGHTRSLRRATMSRRKGELQSRATHRDGR
jgi:hypothetical protein